MSMIRSLVLVLASLLALPCFAQEVAVTVVGEAACPSRQAVIDALERLVPSARVVDDPSHAVLSATVTDLGDRYDVNVTAEKVIADPDHRCDERARSTALVLALAIDELPPKAAEPVVPTPVRAHGPGPWPYIDRPLVLPFGKAQITDELNLGVLRAGSAHAVGVTEVIGGDVGVGRRVQLGAFVAAPVEQKTGDVSLVSRVTVGLHRDVALRIELGYERASLLDADGRHGVLSGGFFALSLLTRIRLEPWLTIAFGDTGPRTEWAAYIGRPVDTELMAYTSHALVAVRIDAAFTDASICLPVSLLFQPHHMVALQLGAAVRARFDQTGLLYDGTGFPLSFDLIVSPHERVDVGVGFDAPLQINAPGAVFLSALFVRSRL